MQSKIPPLSYYVRRALDFIGENRGFKLNLPESRRTLVVGSGNAYWTGRLIYRLSDRKFSHAEEVQAIHHIDSEHEDLGDVTIVSATGSRQVVDVAKYAMDKGLKVNSITCNPNSELKAALGERINEILIPSISEPPTINTASYGMMLYGITGEGPKPITDFLQEINAPSQGYATYDSFSTILPDSMLELGRMASWKMHEIFGRSRGTLGTNATQLIHGGAVRDSDRELFIGIGVGGKVFDRIRRVPPPEEKRHIVSLPAGFGPLGYFMTTYHIIGMIQEQLNDRGFGRGLETY
jgi:hypothetical protein